MRSTQYHVTRCVHGVGTLSIGSQNVDGFEPDCGGLRPGGHGKVILGAQAVAVAAFGVEVELGGDVDGFESEEPGRRVFDVDAIVFCLDEERRRGVGGRVKI